MKKVIVYLPHRVETYTYNDDQDLWYYNGKPVAKFDGYSMEAFVDDMRENGVRVETI